MRFPHSRRNVALLLCLLVIMATAGGVVAAAEGSGGAPSIAYRCKSLMQCYVVRLGAPQSPGEWLVAYLSAAHEHCRDLMEQGGAIRCQASTRCTYITTTGSLLSSSSSSSGGGKDTVGGTSYLVAASSNIKRAAQPDAGANSSSSSSHALAPAPDYWQRTAAALKLTQPTCLPNPFNLVDMHTHACPHNKAALRSPEVGNASPAGEQMMKTCLSSPDACLIANASSPADVAAWWSGALPRAVLESNSSWLAAGRIQEATIACSAAWQAGSVPVQAVCATRGIGFNYGNTSSITVGRLVVAVMDGYESSGCNNTVTFSEALAVQRIVQDLSSRVCPNSGCRQTSGAARAGAGARGDGSALLQLLAGRPAVYALLLLLAAAVVLPAGLA